MLPRPQPREGAGWTGAGEQEAGDDDLPAELATAGFIMPTDSWRRPVRCCGRRSRWRRNSSRGWRCRRRRARRNGPIGTAG